MLNERLRVFKKWYDSITELVFVNTNIFERLMVVLGIYAASVTTSMLGRALVLMVVIEYAICWVKKEIRGV